MHRFGGLVPGPTSSGVLSCPAQGQLLFRLEDVAVPRVWWEKRLRTGDRTAVVSEPPLSGRRVAALRGACCV